jgi:PAS domain S-box-containing protein
MLSLRSRLTIAGIVAVTIPLLLVGTFTYSTLSAALELVGGESQADIAAVVATFLQENLSQRLALVSALSTDPKMVDGISNGDFQGTRAQIGAAAAVLGEEYSTVIVMDENGIVEIDVLDENNAGLDLSNRDYFLAAKAGNLSLSGPLYSRVDGELLVVACAPVHSADGSFVGAVAAPVGVTTIMNRLWFLGTGSTEHHLIVDRDGQVIPYLNDLPEQWIDVSEDVNRTLTEQIGADMQRWGVYSTGPVRKVAGFASVDIIGWTVVAAQDRAEILAPAQNAFVVIGIVGVVLIGLSLGAVALLSVQVSGPIQDALETLRQITYHSPNVMMSIGPDRRITSVNPAMERIAGRTAAELKGTTPSLSNSENTPEETIWSVLDQGNVWSGQLVLENDDREPATLEALILPLMDQKGTVHGYLETGRDISQQLAMARRLSEAQKLQALGTLAGGIAHDFNNVLTGIFGYGDLALNTSDDPDQTKEFIKEILSAAERAHEIVNQILAFSRMDSAQLRPIVPSLAVREALKLLSATLPKTIELRSTITTEAVVLADPTHMHQIVINLCTNASHAMNDSKGILTVTMEDRSISEEETVAYPSISAGEHVLIKVTDTGRGMPQDVLDRVFEPFFTTKERGEGTGIGLSVVHGIVREMNGSISVYSEVDMGTVVSILIPATGDAGSTEPQEDAVSVPGGNERILLVDDEERMLRATEGILTTLGYDVESVSESPLALLRFQRNPEAYDLLVVDHMMPKMTGVEFTHQAHKLNATIPVILYSGYLYADLRGAPAEVGISGVLNKPARMHELAQAVRRALDGRKPR